jgi:hypothetical protein
MSYAPIYAKLRDLEERLIKVESTPSSISLAHPVVSSSSTISDTVIDNSSDLTKLLNDCALNSSSITQLSNTIAMLATKDELVPLATKDELVPLATKDELVHLATKDELVPLATKDELVPLATKDELVSKDELANLFVKFDNIINVVAQLNTRIDELYTKIQ